MLDHAVVGNVLKDRIPGVTDRYDDGLGLGGHFPEIVSKGEHGPVIVDGAKVGILAVVENTVRDERGAKGDVTSSPVGRVEILRAP